MSDQYLGTPGAPDAFLVDIDGTIAHNDGHRGFFEWSKVYDDKPHQDVIDIVYRLWITGLQPVFVSGRSDACYRDSEAWVKHAVFPGKFDMSIPLYMRADGDNRQDAIVKLEIFDSKIRDNYNVLFCLDDRNQVVAAYRSIGLRVLQVAEGNF